MSFPRCLLSSALLAGTVFSATTFPLAAMGSQPLTIELEKQPVFAGQLKELAAPYLGIATAISIGTGVASLAISSWRNSSRKLNQTEEEMANLRKELQERNSLIEQLKFSEAKLAASGLSDFLDIPHETSPSVHQVQFSAKDPEVAPKSVESTRPVVQANHPLSQPVGSSAYAVKVPAPQAKFTIVNPELKPEAISQDLKTRAATALAAAQAFNGYTQPASAGKATKVEPENPAQMDDLLNHLKQVMNQIERLHAVQPGAPESWKQQQLAS